MKTKIFLIASGVLFSLFLVEMFLRIFQPQIVYANLKQNFAFDCYAKASYTWVHLKKNAECMLSSNTNTDFSNIAVKTNSLGLRNPEVKPQKTDGVDRIIFVGDSFTMGWGVAEMDAFPQRVERILRSQKPSLKTETINAGIPTTAVDDYYLYLKEEGLQLNPDYLIIGFFLYNDIITNNLWTSVDNDGLPLHIESALYFINSEGALDDKRMPFKFRVPVLRDSHLFAFLIERLSPFFPQGKDAFLTEDLGQELCLFKRSCRKLEEKKAATRKLFLAIKKLTDKKGIKMLVLLIPAKFQVYDAIPSPFTIPLLQRDKRYPHEEFTLFFQKNEIASLDLLPIMRKYQSKQLYFPNDPHWNAQGHRLATEEVVQYLKQTAP